MTMAAGVYGPFFRDALTNTKAFALGSGGDTLKVALVANAYTPAFDTHDEFADLTNEVSGTGWASGGVALASQTIGIASGALTFDAADVSQSGTTLTSARGAVVYDDTLTGDPLIVASNFGADYSTSSGTFAITWNASGIFTIDYTP